LSWFYYVGRGIMRLLLALLLRWEVRGKENVPASGGFLVVANHLHAADPPLLGVSIPRHVVFMAKEQLFRFPPIAYFVRGFGAFPVHRNRLDREALRQAQAVLASGRGLVMFPESHRSLNGKLQRALPGAAMLARYTGVPILPVGITGTEQIKGFTWLFRRPRLVVTIGVPFRLPPADGRAEKLERTENTELIMRRIAVLLPERYRGVYGRPGQ